MTTETIIRFAAILIPIIGIIAIIAGKIILSLIKKKRAFQTNPKKFKSIAIFAVIWGCTGIGSGIFLWLWYIPYVLPGI